MRTLSASLLKVAGLAIIALALTVFLACGSSSDANDSDAAIDDGAVVADEHVDDDDDDHDADTADDDHDADAADDDHDADAADERVIHVHAESMEFDPGTITVKVGETIRITLDNHDPILHDYTTDEADFIVIEASGAVHSDHEEVSPDDDDGMDMDGDAQVSLQPLHVAAEANDHGDLVFQATEAGEYVFYCSVPGHLEAGMVGTIIVEE